MTEEMKTILQMIQCGKITAEEGEKLIESLSPKNEVISATKKVNSAKFIHVEVTDDTDDTLVKVNVPIMLAKAMFKIGNIEKQISLNAPGIDINFDEIISMIDANNVGELLNIETEDNKVRIWID